MWLDDAVSNLLVGQADLGKVYDSGSDISLVHFFEVEIAGYSLTG